MLRVSGPAAGQALAALAGSIPPPRSARLNWLTDSAGERLDQALVLWFPGPHSVTGEDLAEFHVHGGRAVISAVEAALDDLPTIRRALPGEFTRRAFANGRIDLAEAEGLADLLSAETELQRRAAITSVGGHLSRRFEDWRTRLLSLSAHVEAVLDFEDEDDVEELPASFYSGLSQLAEEVADALAAPATETLREGFRVALAGPPNAGKSTLFNALVESEAAITASVAGTTRDVLTKPVALGGIPFLFVDMAGLRSDASDEVEAQGISRAKAELDRADLVLWLGAEGEGPDGSWEIAPQSDRPKSARKSNEAFSLSALTGEGLPRLKDALIERALRAMPGPGEAAVSLRQRQVLMQFGEALDDALRQLDPLCLAEALRQARTAVDALIGRSSTEDVLDALFGRFCIGK